jgi:hypothetical protein
MAGTLIGQVMRETVQRDMSILPLEVICFGDQTVKLIVSLDYREEAPKPLLVRAWDWMGPRPRGRAGTVRGTLRILAINACGVAQGIFERRLLIHGLVGVRIARAGEKSWVWSQKHVAYKRSS